MTKAATSRVAAFDFVRKRKNKYNTNTMIRPILSIIASSTVLTGMAYVLDPAARCAEAKDMLRHSTHMQINGTAEDYYYPMIIDISDERAIGELESLGCVIFNRRDDLLLTCVPADKLRFIGSVKYLKRAALSKTAMATMDIAREASNVNTLHDGSCFDLIADGSGVVVGLCDIGMDPNFIEFGDRVRRVVDYNATYAERMSAEDDDVKEWTTDNANQYHGTHVCGILAGEPGYSPYYGVASGASIVATTSRLSDVGILAGAEDVIDYAKSVGQPAVINMSLGDYLGPHDGSDLFCQYLDRCADDALIVLSAGNEGNSNISLRHTFTTEEPTVGTAIENMVWDGMDITGTSDLWSFDDKAFEVQIDIWDCDAEQYVYKSEWLGNDISGDGYWSVSSDTDPEFAKLYSGYIQAAWELSPYNNRYNIQVNYNAVCAKRKSGSSTSRYYICLSVRADVGASVYLYADGQNTWFRNPGIQGLKNGTSECSISNMSCSYKTLTVGAYVSRNTIPSISGGNTHLDLTTGIPTASTSYGTLIDGRTLPHLCAPGAYIVAPLSSYYAEANTQSTVSACYSARFNNRDYYWTAIGGTSMASPHMAGIAACWLSINPALTPAQLRDIAIETADDSSVTGTNPRWGAGLVDAVAGAKKIIESGITSVRTDTPNTDIVYFNLSGHQVDINNAQPGIYIAIVNGKAKKIAVR